MIYYETTFKGKLIRIPARSYAALYKRFDPKYIEDSFRQRIDRPCPLCIRSSCHVECPFFVLGRYGCMVIISARTGRKTKRVLSIGYSDVSWRHDDNREAHRRLKRIQEELKKFKRVET